MLGVKHTKKITEQLCNHSLTASTFFKPDLSLPMSFSNSVMLERQVICGETQESHISCITQNTIPTCVVLGGQQSPHSLALAVRFSTITSTVSLCLFLLDLSSFWHRLKLFTESCHLRVFPLQHGDHVVKQSDASAHTQPYVQQSNIYHFSLTSRRKENRTNIYIVNRKRPVLVDAGLGVGYLVETGHFESPGVSSLSFVHVVSKGQHHLQELTQRPALHHLLGCNAQSWNTMSTCILTSYNIFSRAQHTEQNSTHEFTDFWRERNTFDFRFDLSHSFSKLLLEVEGLQSLLVVVDARRGQNQTATL